VPKVFAPNKQYNGISASVLFTDGVGETEDPYLLEWFEQNGYTVESKDHAPEPKVDELKTLKDISATELRDLAREKGIKGYSNMTRNQLLKVLEVE
jgi:hypothetical protein